MPTISLVIMTYNEEKDIGRCLDSARDIADEMIVVDSYSEDATARICASKGAVVINHPFEGYIEQRRFSIQQAKCQYVLVLDADEYLSKTLRTSLLKFKKNTTAADVYFINRCNNIGGQWIRHGGWYPDRKIRLFKKGMVRVVGEQPHDKTIAKPAASVQRLKGDILHLSDTGIKNRYETINKHSQSAAVALFKKGRKTNWGAIAGRPLWRFVKEYIVKQGFRDGFYGFIVALSSAHYVYLREVKLMEYWRWKRMGIDPAQPFSPPNRKV